MLVYGDIAGTVDPRQKLAALDALIRQGADMPAGIGRHGLLVAALIEAGTLLQGLADAASSPNRQDEAEISAATTLLMHCADAVWRSWTSGFAHPPSPAAESVAAVGTATLPATISTRLPEGFAFYAVYPEAFATAAFASGLPATTRVIGIRSVGAPLSAMVATALGAGDPVTVRPTGHPFERTLSLSECGKARVLAGSPSGFAIVDEGPGLSGSSFGAIADFLEDSGVEAASIAAFPSHAGAPGPQSSARHRDRWSRIPRHVIDFDALILRAERPEHRLETWVAAVLGPLEGPLEDISGGEWRRRVPRLEADWPPVNAGQERRKFLARAGGARWLVKFAGLGLEGQRKCERGQALHRAGFTPEVAGFCHGFIVERWLDGARPLDRSRIEPLTLAEQVGRYLGFRARSFPAHADRGATLAELMAMARHNVAEALGPAASRGLARWSTDDLARLGARMRPVETDNRLHAWEWLVRVDGRLCKCDALDHHAAHDLVGCQDIAWDVVGASVELALPPPARTRLRTVVEIESGRGVDPQLVALLTPCYLAFQLGSATMALAAAADAAEAHRLRRQVDRYATLLRED